jgi:hypothetical protein
MQADEFKETTIIPYLVEALQAVDLEAITSLKQIMVVTFQERGSRNGGVDVPLMSATFYEPSLRGDP